MNSRQSPIVTLQKESDRVVLQLQLWETSERSRDRCMCNTSPLFGCSSSPVNPEEIIVGKEQA